VAWAWGGGRGADRGKSGWQGLPCLPCCSMLAVAAIPTPADLFARLCFASGAAKAALLASCAVEITTLTTNASLEILPVRARCSARTVHSAGTVDS
jgi:hypothetical protein